ncbi:MAG: plastocyanin/azurin family copper-binding protein [Vicinamibacterales bacterium]
MMTVRNVIVLSALVLSAACGSSTPTTPTPQPTNAAVSIVAGARTLGSNAFTSNPASVTVGATVTWTNNDTLTHTVTSDSGAFDSGNLAPGAKFTFTFQTKGTFAYHCTPHPGMVASVVVQ